MDPRFREDDEEELGMTEGGGWVTMKRSGEDEYGERGMSVRNSRGWGPWVLKMQVGTYDCLKHLEVHDAAFTLRL